MRLFKNMHEDRGAITLSDVLIVLVSAVFIGAVAVPFMLGQQADMNKLSAELAAKSAAIEVETLLIVNSEEQVPSPVVITHNPNTQELSIQLSTISGTDAAVVPFTLPEGVSLVSPDPTSPDLAGANTVYSRDNYCIAVQSFGQLAFHGSKGPAESCPQVSVTAANSLDEENASEVLDSEEVSQESE